ncbi:MAG TPA: alpha/beta hydrolase-fold protein [Chitinophagaceae bacterium]|nr:alpha/beta hydrolase-fold protein [Chitinophagaceae bacterium]
MHRYCFIIACLIFPAFAIAQDQYKIYSRYTNDNYIITIKNHNAGIAQHAVYVADGSLKLGHYVLGTDADWKATLPANCVIITIAHIGDWHEKRQRDFIPSDAGGYSDTVFGKAKQFYLFLQNELLPFVNKKLANQSDRSFVGHSFSALFCLYASLQTVKLFDNYFAISRSIWANYYELGKIEGRYAKAQKTLKGKIFLYAGSLEIFNKVLSSTQDYYATLNSRRYAGLTVGYREIRSANHFSIIKPAIDNILISISK